MIAEFATRKRVLLIHDFVITFPLYCPLSCERIVLSHQTAIILFYDHQEQANTKYFFVERNSAEARHDKLRHQPRFALDTLAFKKIQRT